MEQRKKERRMGDKGQDGAKVEKKSRNRIRKKN